MGVQGRWMVMIEIKINSILSGTEPNGAQSDFKTLHLVLPPAVWGATSRDSARCTRPLSAVLLHVSRGFGNSVLDNPDPVGALMLTASQTCLSRAQPWYSLLITVFTSSLQVPSAAVLLPKHINLSVFVTFVSVNWVFKEHILSQTFCTCCPAKILTFNLNIFASV